MFASSSSCKGSLQRMGTTEPPLSRISWARALQLCPWRRRLWSRSLHTLLDDYAAFHDEGHRLQYGNVRKGITCDSYQVAVTAHLDGANVLRSPESLGRCDCGCLDR